MHNTKVCTNEQLNLAYNSHAIGITHHCMYIFVRGQIPVERNENMKKYNSSQKYVSMFNCILRFIIDKRYEGTC